MPLHVWRACLSARIVCLLILAVARARESADARCVCARHLVCLCARAHTACVNERCARACALRPTHVGDVRNLMARPAPSFAAARAWLRSARPAGCRARSGAGVTWTSRTLAAPWDARYAHTSVVDAAGAIYVIGGFGGSRGNAWNQDVWASTDGGARPDSVKGGWSAGYLGVLRRTKGVLKGTTGYCRVLHGTTGGAKGVVQGH
jgi:hypothetical protein